MDRLACSDTGSVREKATTKLRGKVTKMQKPVKAAVVVVLALMIVMAILPPMWFGRQPENEPQDLGDRWLNFIFNYQSLITGFLAVGAAFVTVRRMRQDDLNANDRHRELVILSLRRDSLRVERALMPQFNELRLNAEELAKIHKAISDLGDLPPETRADSVIAILADNYDDMVGYTQQISSILNRTQFVSAEELFGGDLAYSTETIRDRLNSESNWQKIVAAQYLRADEQDRRFLIEVNLGRSYEQIESFLEFCSRWIPLVVRDLRDLGDQYGVVLR